MARSKLIKNPFGMGGIARAKAGESREAESLLSRMTQGKRTGPRRTLVYGIQGVGKSTFASEAPRPVFLPTEDGTRDLDVTRFPLLRSYDECLEALGELYRPDHSFRTVVIDSLDSLEHLIWEKTAEDRGVPSIEDLPYRKGYLFALDYWRRILDGLDALRRERFMGAVLIAHSRTERFESPDAESYDRYAPRIHRIAADLVQAWADEVLFACFKVAANMPAEKVNGERAQGLSTVERVLRTVERPSHKAKNRLGLPEEIPLSWSAYAEYFPKKGE